MSWFSNLPLRFKIGGTIVTIIGLILYFWRGLDIALVLCAIGIVALLIGFIWKPQRKTETT
jgi:multisubunit Na+/H+ antiporter MnhB subunit